MPAGCTNQSRSSSRSTTGSSETSPSVSAELNVDPTFTMEWVVSDPHFREPHAQARVSAQVLRRPPVLRAPIESRHDRPPRLVQQLRGPRYPFRDATEPDAQDSCPGDRRTSGALNALEGVSGIGRHEARDHQCWRARTRAKRAKICGEPNTRSSVSAGSRAPSLGRSDGPRRSHERTSDTHGARRFVVQSMGLRRYPEGLIRGLPRGAPHGAGSSARRRGWAPASPRDGPAFRVHVGSRPTTIRRDVGRAR